MEETIVETTNVAPPTKLIVENRLNRFGKIFFNMAITAASLTLFALLATIITPVIYLVALAVLFGIICVIFICSLGLVLAIPDNILTKLWSLLGFVMDSGGSMGSISAFCFNISQWFALAGMILSALGIVFISLTKRKNKTTKIIALSILTTLLLGVFLFFVITGGMQWQG